MAIVKMDHFNLFAFDSDIDTMMHSLQDFGDIQFNDLSALNTYDEEELNEYEVPREIQDINDELSRVTWMLDVISSYSTKKSGLAAMKDGIPTYSYEDFKAKGKAFNTDELYDSLVKITDEMSKKEERVSNLTLERQELYPWRYMENRVDELKDGKDLRFVTGYIPFRFYDRFAESIEDLDYTYLEKVSMAGQNNYVLIIYVDEDAEKLNEIFRLNAFNRVTLKTDIAPSEQIELIDVEMAQLKDEIEAHGREIAKLSSGLEQLELKYEYLLNDKLRVASVGNFLKTEQIGLIEGYVPSKRSAEFKELIGEVLGNRYYMEIENADVDDVNVPVTLENNTFVSSFENITSMYAMPRYGEIDPTPLLAPFYLIFFGMMIADVGYGLLLLIATAIGMKAFNLSEGMKKNLRFFFYLSFPTIAWGIIYGSFFGGIIELPVYINLEEDYMTVMILSMALGALQMFFGLAIKAFMSIRDGHPLDAVYDVLLWYMTLIGLIVFGVATMLGLPGSIGKIAMIVAIIGMVGIVLFGGRSSKSLGGRLAGGLYELYGISSYIGDFVSYVRLMALGLSGAFLGSAINMIVGMLSGSGIIGIIAGIVVFIIGQLFNLFLSALSAYVHGLRLTYVEFFGKFYEGGGRRYKNLRNNTKYIEIK